MEDLKETLTSFSQRSRQHKVTPREMKAMANIIINDALEYHLSEYINDEYLETLLSDIRENRC